MGFNVFHLAAWYLVFVVSTTLHEAAHALAALKLGDPTAYHGGQVSLDPRPHMKREPIGMIWVPLISFMVSGGGLIGWASTPIDAEWAWRWPRRSALTSLAGPLANFAQALLAFVLLRIGLIAGVFPSAQGLWVVPFFILSIVLTLNLLLFLLNMVPVPPFDGGSVLMLFMDDGAARRWMARRVNRRNTAIVLLVVFFGFQYIFDPIMHLTVRLLYWDVSY